MIRNKTREVSIGSVRIGGDHRIAVQTMWDRPVTDIETTLETMRSLKETGCDLIRFSIQDEEALEPFGRICSSGIMPVVADIHFDHTLALRAVRAGADKIRINPGNIGASWKVKEVLTCCKDHGCAIRIGVNGGSLPVAMRERQDVSDAMIEVVSGYIDLFESCSFSQTVVSLKDSDPAVCLEVNRKFSSLFDLPLHLGLTEAGPLIPAVTKSTYALAPLLCEGIGDTVRISITGPLEDEVYAAVELLKVTGRMTDGIRIVSCPKCGRAGFDTHSFIDSISADLQRISGVGLTVAVMGCAVNGPGEARDADLGITGLGNQVVIFRSGKIIERVGAKDARKAFLRQLGDIIDETDHHQGS